MRYIYIIIITQKQRDMKIQIEKELGQTIEIVKEHEGFVIFDCEDGTRRTNKLTKTGKHKKGSIRVW